MSIGVLVVCVSVRVLDPVELELSRWLLGAMGVLGSEPRYSEGPANALNHGASPTLIQL